MAAVGECFSIGSFVACKTCFNETVEGEVLAFDQNTKMLILKCRSKNSEKLNDVSILNLQFCSDVKVINEANGSNQPQPLNINRLKTRLRNSVDQRQRWLTSKNAGVSVEGQNLFMAIGKTLDNHVSWDGLNIIVFNEVTITPPYKKENVSADNPQKINSVNYVKKLIDQNNKISQGNTITTASTSTTTTTTTTTTTSTAVAAAVAVVSTTAATTITTPTTTTITTTESVSSAPAIPSTTINAITSSTSTTSTKVATSSSSPVPAN